MRQSMTGFASGQGSAGRYRWTWEIRSVNARGLDLRLRVPDWIEGLETALRACLGKAVKRGNITLNLRLQADEGAAPQQLNADQLDATLTALAEVETRAMDRGITLAPATATGILALRGILDNSTTDTDTAGLRDTLEADFIPVLKSFCAMREAEGEALQSILTAQIDQIKLLTGEAETLGEVRRKDMAARMKTALSRALDNTDGADPDRVAQELALIAVKADVTEELDRLHAHVAAARDLLASDGPVGRRLDFLTQEFNREANTLSSKAQFQPLTRVGLDLKTVIDQMREQVQNVE
ncbi:YicC/YloC family endoribonuclease [Primorskyibacter flagellatus]|uniref:TIGR00255 family protein n=1 Tax=Primorskyibacter flagellatus TaxID=1387277 RepID=A0A1W1Z6P5_9RHOB|nr:YicC/YloC family endoribonuclease [Primorskyibacter flagellatus]SMC44093.1 TIGR00255 family protein [Primorskyibacter flagellatus]